MAGSIAPTPADGSVSASNLVNGTYNVSAIAPGYDGATQQVTLTAGPMPVVEIRLESTAGILEGQVTDVVSGAGLSGATVSLARWTAVTDTDGRYRLEGVLPGTYTVQVTLEGYGVQQLAVTIEPRGRHNLDATLNPVPGTLKVRVVDAATGLPIEGATVNYGRVDPVAAEAVEPCADYSLLVPLKRSAEYRAIRKRVADPRPADTWQQDGLHFFVFTLTSDGAESDMPSPTEPPVAVFVMRQGVPEPVSAVVVRPRPDGLDAETTPIVELEPTADPIGS